jgi:hypothetical protein
MSKQPYFTRQQWILFRAEQLAHRANPDEFVTRYTQRTILFGDKYYPEANQAFRDFLQPYITEARRAYEAESKAWLQNFAKKEIAAHGEGTYAHDMVPGEDDPIDEDEDQEEYVCNCGAEIAKNQHICDDCEDENGECENCGAVVGKDDALCEDCDNLEMED